MINIESNNLIFAKVTVLESYSTSIIRIQQMLITFKHITFLLSSSILKSLTRLKWCGPVAVNHLLSAVKSFLESICVHYSVKLSPVYIRLGITGRIDEAWDSMLCHETSNTSVKGHRSGSSRWKSFGVGKPIIVHVDIIVGWPDFRIFRFVRRLPEQSLLGDPGILSWFSKRGNSFPFLTAHSAPDSLLIIVSQINQCLVTFQTWWNVTTSTLSAHNVDVWEVGWSWLCVSIEWEKCVGGVADSVPIWSDQLRQLFLIKRCRI